MRESQKSWRLSATLGISFLLAICACIPAHQNMQAQPSTPHDVRAAQVDPAPWVLAWSDEFNQPDGAAPDPAKWSFDEGVGGNGWGNNELEYYTRRPKNAVVQNGNLVITALREKFSGPSGVTRSFTSARLKTRGHFSQAYGRFEARIKIPAGAGLWPAFWLLGDNIGSVGWPQCGEIDVMENIGPEPFTVHGSIHGPGFSGANGLNAPFTLPHEWRVADAYHVFAIEWEPNVIRFYVDGVLYATRTPADLPAKGHWVFDHPFFIILNLAVGGDWPGPPDSTTNFPAAMLVDYVRVYQRPH